MEPDALGPGLREWFGSLGHYPVKAAAFDTRMHGPATLTGRASKTVARLLRAHGRQGLGKQGRSGCSQGTFVLTLTRAGCLELL
jgi:hypothetical protein